MKTETSVLRSRANNGCSQRWRINCVDIAVEIMQVLDIDGQYRAPFPESDASRADIFPGLC